MQDAPTPFDAISPDAEETAATTFSDACDTAPSPSQATRLSEEITAPPASGGGWTIPFICAGIAMIACCILIPAAEENRRLVFEREGLKADLAQIQRQMEVNDEFLKRVADDPSLSERLAQRQMKMVRQGTSVLELKGQPSGRDMSPYELTTLAPPPELPPYQPRGGTLGSLVSNPRSQLYIMGCGMLLVAAGLVMGGSNRSAETVAT